MNCILTPHIAGITEESNTRVSEFIARKVLLLSVSSGAIAYTLEPLSLSIEK